MTAGSSCRLRRLSWTATMACHSNAFPARMSAEVAAAAAGPARTGSRPNTWFAPLPLTHDSGLAWSLGIVTFSKAQADMVTEILEFERRQDEVLNDFLREGRAEDVFVKNIENVQGDERDVIFISVGYGPAEPGGRLRNMRFGPINAEGGERRLNVLFTRARARCRVFASFDPGDMDPSRTSSGWSENPETVSRLCQDRRGSGTQPGSGRSRQPV